MTVVKVISPSWDQVVVCSPTIMMNSTTNVLLVTLLALPVLVWVNLNVPLVDQVGNSSMNSKILVNVNKSQKKTKENTTMSQCVLKDTNY